MEELPIDIHYAKLLDWLLDRKKVPHGWHESVRAIRAGVDEALQDLPDVAEAREFASGRYLDYFACKRMVEILGRTQKDMFGRFRDERSRRWSDLVAAYEKEDVFLAEAAQLMAKQVDVEIPAMRRRVAKLQTSLGEAGRREAEAAKTAQQQEADLHEHCARLGISDASLPLEPQLVDALRDSAPAAAEVVARRVGSDSVGAALEYYERYVKRSGVEEAQHCPVLRRVRLAAQEQESQSDLDAVRAEAAAPVANGGDPRSGPATAGAPDGDAQVPGTEDDSGVGAHDPTPMTAESEFRTSDEHKVSGGDQPEIDFGAEPQIDFGAEPQIDFGAELQIDFGTEPQIDFGGEPQIDFGADPQIDFGSFEVVTEGRDGAAEASPAGGSFAECLLDESTRHEFLTDAYELDAFLQQRQTELNQGSRRGGLGILLLEADSKFESLQEYNLERTSSLRETVQGVIAACTGPEARETLTLYSSRRALQRTVRQLEEKKFISERLTRMVQEIEMRRQREVEELNATGPRISQAIAYVKELKVCTEAALTKQYKPRKVNLMGEINTL